MSLLVSSRFSRSWLVLSLALVAMDAAAANVAFSTLEPDIIQTRLSRSSRKNSERKATLQEMFEEVGCLGERLVEKPVAGSKLPNLECTLAGTTDSVIVVGAHFDMVEVGDGVVDNWSGASLLPSFYESLAGTQHRHTFVFVGFTDEERGLVGSASYTKQLTKEQKVRTRAMVNLDTLGLSPAKVDTGRADARLLGLLKALAQNLNLPLTEMSVDRYGDTDSTSFSKTKIPSLTIHSLTQETVPILHSVRDNMNAINLMDYYDTYRLVTAYLADLDAHLQ